MRQIKFRAWNKKLNRFVPNLNSQQIIFQGGFTLYQGGDLKFQQFTGMKDKKGKEIYEGDIVKVHASEVKGKNHLEEVKWFSDKESLEENRFCTSKSEGWLNSELEVIGNIYENKNLKRKTKCQKILLK